MSLRRRAYGKAWQRWQTLTSDYIWISDDFLDRALRRFLVPQCSRRHGSSVPGPLEAQRRATKRRMRGLALAGARGGDIDPSLLRRIPEQQKWQWQGPTAAEPPNTPFIQGTDIGNSSLNLQF